MHGTLRRPFVAVLAFLSSWILAGQPAARCAEAGATTTTSSCPTCGIDYRGRDLRGLNFARMDLRGSDFRNAKLEGTVFIGADLRFARFEGATFGSGDGPPTDLSASDLRQAIFSGTRLGTTDLQHARLGCADFARSDLQRAKLGPDVDTKPADASCQTRFDGALLGCREGEQLALLDLGAIRPLVCPPSSAAKADVDVSMTCGAADLSVLTSAVYVAPGGSDASGCGTSSGNACATIQAGIDACSGSGCGVVVAYGQYRPSQSIVLADGVGVYGGCVASGSSDPGYQSLVYAPAQGVPAFSGSSLGTPAVIHGFEIQGSDTNEVGAETIAVTFDDVSGLTVQYTTVVAGTGGDGAGGTVGSAGAFGDSASGQDGADSSCDSSGGDGANGGTVSQQFGFTWYLACHGECSYTWYYGESGQPGGTGHSAGYGSQARVPAGDAGCDDSDSNGCTGMCLAWPQSYSPEAGGTGSSGDSPSCAAAGGTASSDVSGGFSGTSWTGSIASGGVGGANAGGGGGGGGGVSCGYGNSLCSGTSYSGGYGGGGGAGGCGGGGGGGGGQGGAAFVIVASASSVGVGDDLHLVGGTGGRGGTGGPGGAGGSGGSGAYGGDGPDCGGVGGSGGSGGLGGAGSGGGGGNGGRAVNIANLQGSTFSGQGITQYLGYSGAAGGAGTGGNNPGTCVAGSGSPGNAGTVATSHAY